MTRLARVEDAALLTGQGRFLDDLDPLPGTLVAAVVRSPHAHARISRVDLERAKIDFALDESADPATHAVSDVKGSTSANADAMRDVESRRTSKRVLVRVPRSSKEKSKAKGR